MAAYLNANAKLALDLLTAKCDTGSGTPSGVAHLKIYSGNVPTTCGTALGGGNTVLADLPMSNPAFGAAATINSGLFNESAQSTAAAITTDNSADATGTATFARIFDRSQTTPVAVFQLTVSATGGAGELQLNSVNLVAGTPVAVTALTLTLPNT